MRTLILAALCAAAVPAASADCSPASAPSATWTCLTGGAAAAKPGTTVLRDGASWKSFWTASVPAVPVPAVDFARESVQVSFAADAAGRPSFKAVKVARTAPSQADALSAKAAAGQPSAAERAARLLPSVPSAARASSFDGASVSSELRDAVAAPASAPRFVPLQARCTPGVDCPETKPTHKAPRCTPGVDCPEDRHPRREPGCTPGVDCPGDGRTPLPPNYRPRPRGEPSRFPPLGDPDVYDHAVAGDWHAYRYFGSPVETAGRWSDYDTARARVERGGAEVGVQGTSYVANLDSRSERLVYRVYWRYVGTDCDPNDDSQCLDWRVQYARFPERRDSRSASAVVEVRFDDSGMKLLPWEKDTLFVTFDGYRVGYDASYAAFRYSVRGPVIDQQTGRATIEFTAIERIKRRPESDKVLARLEKGPSGLQLSVLDRRADFYDGEPLEIAYKVKKDCNGWFCSDKVVAERAYQDPLRVIVKKGGDLQAVVPVPDTGSGKYYVVWSFRRAQSKISADSWADQGKGPKVQY